MPVLAQIWLRCAITPCALVGATVSCSPAPEISPSCGPEVAWVDTVVDGDTIILDTGETVRYLLVDSPETRGEQECYGLEATAFNRDLVAESMVRLEYDVACHDAYGRLLAYVFAGERGEWDVNATLLELGYACVLHVPPNGAGHVERFRSLEQASQRAGRGLWGACSTRVCGR